HIGALAYLLPEFVVPVYGNPLTLAVARQRLPELGALARADLRPYRPGDEIRVGGLVVEPIRVTHSIADGIGLAIETPAGTVVHTGDFKLDESPVDAAQPDYARFRALGERGVLALCSDSTNVGRPGRTGSETEVGAALQGRFAQAPGRILVATFASHIHRIQQVLNLAAAYSRKVALLGRSMVANVAVASELGYLKVPDGLLVTLEELGELPARRQVILSTGSQGETHSARLADGAGVPPERVFLVEDGLGLELSKSGARVLAGYPTGRIFVDGKGIGDVGQVVLRDRQLLAEAGMVVVALTIDKISGSVVAGPEIASRGFVYMKESNELMEEVKRAVREALAAREEPEVIDRELIG